MLIEHAYEWELNGDLEATVYLMLSLDCRIAGNFSLDSVGLVDVTVQGVTYSNQQSDIVCDGQPRGRGLAPNCELPSQLREWFATRFREKYNDFELIREEIADDVYQRAVGEHFERLAVGV